VDIPDASGIKKRTVGRTPVEPVLLCSDSQRQEQGAGSREQVLAYIRGQKEKEEIKG